MKKVLIISLGIILIAFILRIRFFRLGGVPVHLGNDEISLAYDAYSIGSTLRDEHNHFLPLSFQSHGDFKAPLYVYFSALPIKILGNTEFAARLVSAAAGLLTIVLLTLLAYKISSNRALSVLTALVLSLSPWHIYTSRVALEANLAFLFIVLAVYLYLVFQASQKNRLWLIASSVSFGLSIYAYHTEKMLAPLLVLSLPFLYPLKSVFNKFFFWLLSAALGLPYFYDFMHQLGTNARSNTEMVWNTPHIYDFLFHSNNSLIQKFSILFSAIASNYAAHINPGYLFFNGLPLFPQKTPYQFGLLLAASLPFLIVGIIRAKKYFGEYTRFIIFWAVVSPIPSALTRGEPNLIRNLPSLAPYCVLIATGLWSVWLKAGKWLKAFIICSHLIFLLYFLAFYFFHFPVFSGENWQYGYKQIALATKGLYEEYDSIIIDPRFGPDSRYVGIPHLYIPYFAKIDPKIVLARVENNGDIGKYQIREIDWKKESVKPNCLYILPESNLPPKSMPLHLIKTIDLPTGRPAFRILETSD